jgi:formate dehydrogenase assembly factor FdhD
MTRKIDLTVNNTPVDLDYFVAGFLDHVTGGIVASLHDTSEVKRLKLTMNEKDVRINLNGVDVPLNYFAAEIIRNTVLGMLAPLKGVEGAVNKMELNIER